MRIPFFALILLTLSASWSFSAVAENADHTLTLKDHKFTPADMTLPKDTRVKLTVRNLDKSPAEFESSDLGVEKIIPGGGTISVYVGPLGTGRYSYFDEYHEEESQAFITVK